MRNKLIFFISVFVLLFAFIFLIKRNKDARAKVLSKEKRMEDSLNQVKSNYYGNGKGAEKTVVGEIKENASNDKVKVKHENIDFSSFINSSMVNGDNSTEIAVTIVDENGKTVNAIASEIAGIYSRTGKKGNTGLLRSSFLIRPEFQELYDGNSDVIKQLNLKSHTDYLAIGKIRYDFKQGQLVAGTVVCKTTVSMTIISAGNAAIVKSFDVSANGNGVSESQAKEQSVEQLISKYYDHSSI